VEDETSDPILTSNFRWPVPVLVSPFSGETGRGSRRRAATATSCFRWAIRKKGCASVFDPTERWTWKPYPVSPKSGETRWGAQDHPGRET